MQVNNLPNQHVSGLHEQWLLAIKEENEAQFLWLSAVVPKRLNQSDRIYDSSVKYWMYVNT